MKAAASLQSSLGKSHFHVVLDVYTTVTLFASLAINATVLTRSDCCERPLLVSTYIYLRRRSVAFPPITHCYYVVHDASGHHGAAAALRACVCSTRYVRRRLGLILGFWLHRILHPHPTGEEEE